MKLRHRHIAVADSLKTAVRQRVVEYDTEDNPVRFEPETYEPAHVHSIERADGQRVDVHHDNYLRLRELLDGPARGIDEPGDPGEGEDSGAVYIKLDPRLPDNNVTYQRPVSKAALARVRAAVADQTLPVY